ncbi:MAG: LLM class flavin-dependent oxidoreductase [Armatimonadota bacterium]|nr:LLM class flavin-dependent oxidoreductase [Armatimonadota bacterium]
MARTFGVGLPLEAPVAALVDLARDVETLGYSTLWANDERLERDVYSVLAVVAGATRRLRLGPGVTNPYSRHPALTAVAVATLDEISGGRAVLGLGAGGTNHGTLGIKREHPAAALREAVRVIRALLHGDTVTLEGRVVRLYQGHLDFTPPRPDVPIYIGARGPRALETAGELADGAIVGNVATPEGWRYALEHIERGARRAGRRADALHLVAWMYTSIAPDPRAALDAIRPMVATSLVTSRPILDRLGIEMPPRFAAVMDAAGWTASRQVTGRAAAEVPDEIARRFGLAGTPADCAAQLRHLLDAVPEIGHVAIVPFGPDGQSPRGVIRQFIEEVAARVA